MTDAGAVKGAAGLKSLLLGSGDIGSALLAVDWEQTPLGPIDEWPASLRTIVSAVIPSRFSMWMGWGPELTFFCNEAYRRDTLAKKYPWALGKPASEVWAEIWPEIGPRIETVITTGESTWDEALLLILERSGYEEETYHTFSYSPIYDDDGEIAGLLCVVSEETERVIGERRMATLRDLGSVTATVGDERAFLRDASRQLEGNLRSIPFSATYLFDDRGGAELIATTGFTPNHPLVPVHLSPAELADEPAGMIARGESLEVTVEGLSRDFPGLPTGPWPKGPDQAIAVALQSSAGEAPAGFLVLGANRYRPVDGDFLSFAHLIAQRLGAGIASARAYSAELRRAEQLAELDRVKTTFLSTVSHELRTPLTLMLAPLQDSLDEAEPLELEQVELVRRNGLRLLKLVNALLDFSRLEAGRLSAEFHPIDVGALTAELVGTFSDACQRAGIELIVERGALSGRVYLDPDLWERIVLNLISNAFKFTLHGAITVQLGDGPDGTFSLTVSDTGPGIPPEEQTRIFDRFHRVRSVEARSQEGAGIGLSLVRELVELHGGQVGVESTVGRGASFRITLPYGRDHLPSAQVDEETAAVVPGISEMFTGEALSWLPTDEDSAPGGAAAPPATQGGPATGRVTVGFGAPGAARPRVLVADDNPDLRRYLTRLFAPQWEVESVANGTDALARVLESPPDILVTDAMMPGLDGFELIARLRASPATHDLPVIMLSARAGEEASIEGLEAGADDYLPKPFSGRELVARVRSHLELSMLRRQAAAEVAAERQLLEQTVRQMPAGVVLADAATGEVIIANAEVEEILTHPVSGQVVGRPPAHPSFDADRVPLTAESTILSRAIRGGETIHEEHLLHETVDGRTITLLVNAAPIVDEAGEIVAGVAVLRDVTAREQMERLLAYQRDIQEMIATGAELIASLTALALAAEQISAFGGIAAILLASEDGARLEFGVSPSLPSTYSEAIGGSPIGPDAGPSGLSAHLCQTVIVADLLAEGSERLVQLAAELGLRGCWSTPILATNGEAVGVFTVYYPEPRSPSEEEQRLVGLLSRTAALAIERDRDARARDAQIRARMRQLSELQTSLLPPELPEPPGLEVAVAFHPGDRTLEVGGDFYDLFPLDQHAWGFVIGDVCGHGAVAAAVTALTRHTTRGVARLTEDPGEVLVDVSETLRLSGYDRYCTAIYGRLDAAGDGFDLCLAIGGHPYPVIRRASGETEVLDRHGPLLGVLEELTMPTVATRIEPGDTLVLYTDGLVERNPLVADSTDLRSKIAALPTASAEEQLEALEASSLGLVAGEVNDDIAIVLLRAVAV